MPLTWPTARRASPNEIRTTTPMQALLMINGPFSLERASRSWRSACRNKAFDGARI